MPEISKSKVETQLVASIRMKAAYSECGKAFGKIGRKFGRFLCGKPMMLCHDKEYKDVADFEICMPIKEKGRGVSAEGINVKELPGGECYVLEHTGPYEELSNCYCIMLEYLTENQIQAVSPSREVYIKGPGMIFKGNPKKYRTEIQFFVEASQSD